MREVLERFTCDRCGATAERARVHDQEGGLPGWRELVDWPDGRAIPDGSRHLCSACAEEFAWFMAMGEAGGLPVARTGTWPAVVGPGASLDRGGASVVNRGRRSVLVWLVDEEAPSAD